VFAAALLFAACPKTVTFTFNPGCTNNIVWQNPTCQRYRRHRLSSDRSRELHLRDAERHLRPQC
jgi:hypothetical protein